MKAVSDPFLVSLKDIFGQTDLSQFPGIFYVVLLTSIIFILFFARIIELHLLKIRAEYIPDDVLQMNKPFHVSKDKWNTIQEKARIHKADRDEFCSRINSMKSIMSLTDRSIVRTKN
jgi:hypothetical protein